MRSSKCPFSKLPTKTIYPHLATRVGTARFTERSRSIVGQPLAAQSIILGELVLHRRVVNVQKKSALWIFEDNKRESFHNMLTEKQNRGANKYLSAGTLIIIGLELQQLNKNI